AAMAFMLEAGFVGIMIFGWNRVTPRIHLFATAMVTFGASLSAFWIMAANSWMQTPAGGHLEHGTFVIDSYFEGIFNPNMPWGVLHMWTACLETSLFVLGGISAWYLLRGRQVEFFLKSFKLAILLSLFVTPVQIWLGDGSARSALKYQPTKAAAMEGYWETNPPGEGAAWSVLAWPDQDRQRNDWAVQIPNLLSLLATRSLHGEVQGLRAFPREDQPPALPLLFYCFRVMVAIGFWFLGVAVWSLVLWRKGALHTTGIERHRWFLKAWATAVPLGFIAVEAGWIVREVGRQPWIVYGVMRTSETASALPPADVAFTLLGYGFVYAVLGILFLAFAWRLLRQGPDLNLPVPDRWAAPVQAMRGPARPEEPFRLEERS
ncbi:cytochrome ubiquinol oxidase subunit I, partial [bacterium]